jgi:hypothetical protein
MRSPHPCPMQVSSNSTWYRNCFIAADPVWNATASGGVNADCLTANPSETWRCFLQQYAAPYIQTPFMILNSAYDQWQILNDLGLGCVPSTNGKPVAGVPSCSAAQMAVFQVCFTRLQLHQTHYTPHLRARASITAIKYSLVCPLHALLSLVTPGVPHGATHSGRADACGLPTQWRIHRLMFRTRAGKHSSFALAICGGASFACVSESCITGPSQNVDYCSGQSLPNCVGWNLFSVDWNGTSLTMDSAFALWYASLSSQWKKVGHVSAKALL